MTKDQKRKLLKILTGGSFITTPFLVVVFLFLKNLSFGVEKKNKALLKEIEQEEVRLAQITLDFAKYQNHKKVLDTQEIYLPDLRYINYGDIITKEQIENL